MVRRWVEACGADARVFDSEEVDRQAERDRERWAFKSALRQLEEPSDAAVTAYLADKLTAIDFGLLRRANRRRRGRTGKRQEARADDVRRP
jgi:hypothetical protein